MDKHIQKYYKLLPCGKLISKWNKTKSRYCDYCRETENIQHLLYECTRIKNLWLQLSGILQIDIKLKHIILGLQNISTQNEIKNIVVVTVMYAIYSTWVKCSFENICYSTIDLNYIIKEYKTNVAAKRKIRNDSHFTFSLTLCCNLL